MIQRKSVIAIFIAGSAFAFLALAQGPPPGGGRGASGGLGGPGGFGPPAGGRGGRGGFTQYTRPLAPADVIARGKALFETNCASCHASDLRGVIGKGNNILQSSVTMNDKHGEMVAARIKTHSPAITMTDGDSTAVAEYIHGVLATMGGQGGPPRAATQPELNILVGDAKAGEAYFAKSCASCHSVTGDMKGIATKYGEDPKALQNGWVPGTPPIGGGGRGFGGGGRGGGYVGNAVTVTMPNGTKFDGKVVRKDDFLVIITLADGTRKSFPMDVAGPLPKVEVKDPREAHKKMVLALDDPDNKNMHDVTAFLWTLK